MAEPGEYQKLAVRQYPPRSIRETAEGRFWSAFKAPVLTQQIGPVTCLDFCPTVPYDLAVTSSTRVHVYDAKTRKQKKVVSRFKDIAYSGRWRSDGQLLVAGGETGIVQLFDVGSRAVLRHLKGHQGAVHLTRYGGDKVHFLSGGDDRSVRWWDIPSGETLLELGGHTDYVRCGAPSPIDDHLWATGSYDHTVRLWDMRTGQQVLQLAHGKPLEDVAFFPGGGLLVSAGGNYLDVWDIVGGGRRLQRLMNHQKTVTAVQLLQARGGFSGNQSTPRMASASLDGHVKFYELDTFKVTHASKYPAPILSLAVSANCHTMAVGMASGLLSLRTRITTRSSQRSATLAGAPQPPRARRRKRPPLPGTYRYFMRGASEKVTAGAFLVEKGKRARLAAHDKLLRQFHYAEALNAALNTGRAAVVVSVVEELVARQGLRAALGGRDPPQLHALLAFLVSFVASPRYAALLTRVSEVVLDLYGASLGDSPEVTHQLLLLRERILVEVRLQENLHCLRGLLQPLLAASALVS